MEFNCSARTSGRDKITFRLHKNEQLQSYGQVQLMNKGILPKKIVEWHRKG